MSALTTSDFIWDAVAQVRCGVSVSKVIEYFAASPCVVVDMDLNDWILEEQFGRFAVVHFTGILNGIHMQKLPRTLEGTLPVIVGIGNSREFLVDGGHRVAKALTEKRKTILAVILSEEKTRQCVREGQMERFDRETG